MFQGTRKKVRNSTEHFRVDRLLLNFHQLFEYGLEERKQGNEIAVQYKWQVDVEHVRCPPDDQPRLVDCSAYFHALQEPRGRPHVDVLEGI